MLEAPHRFAIADRVEELNRLQRQYGIPALMTIDAPLTHIRLIARPATGRAIDKVFSKGLFSNGNRGPQPGSIATPLQGWPLYQAGMDFRESVELLLNGFRYVPFEGMDHSPVQGAIEVFPKLSQAVLLPRYSIANRPAGTKADDHLFPQLFTMTGDDVDSVLGLVFAQSAINLITQIGRNPRSNHEELAAFVAAIQGVLCVRGESMAVGCAGLSEGYFVLPKFELWHAEWRDAYADIQHDECIEVAISRSVV
jgi:hypothetical protein